MIFFIGLHHPGDARYFRRACMSINTIAKRRKPITTPVLVDSGAFTELSRHGHYRNSVVEYAAQLRRLAGSGVCRILAAASQDYMCEPFILAKTGLSVAQHQRLTIERYDELCRQRPGVLILPVIQGYQPWEYAEHVHAYGDRLTPGMWVGVGSVCKRNSTPDAVQSVLDAVHGERPDLRLHGFGLKSTALARPGVTRRLYSADSMAWSYHARRNNLDANSWREAERYVRKIEGQLQAHRAC